MGQVYKFKSFKLLRAFRKNENKVVLIEIIIENNGIISVYFETESKNLIVNMKVECEVFETEWPESIESARENNYELIPIGIVGEN